MFITGEELKLIFCEDMKATLTVADCSDPVMDKLAEYYATRDLPLCGMLRWLKIDWDRYKKSGVSRTVNRLESRVDTHENGSSTAVMDDPNYLGPNGNWTLD